MTASCGGGSTKDYTWNGSSWLQTNEVRYVYDGNLVVQERNTNNLPQVTYTRGNDLSGKLQGAGGIGGLLARTDNSTLSSQPSTAHAYYHADDNGNVTYLLYPNQTMAAKYLYDPFGNMLAQSGLLADANLYRFSSKEWNANSGLYYYLYRFYDPNLQRWPNRDPLGELGFEIIRKHNAVRTKRIFPEFAELAQGPDLYEFVQNSPVLKADLFGLDCFDDLVKCLNARTTIICGGAGALAGGLGGGSILSVGTGYGVIVGLSGVVTDCYSTYLGCLTGQTPEPPYRPIVPVP